MEEKSLNTDIVKKLIKINELEISKAKVLAIMFKKTTNNIISKKIQSLELSFNEQARFYDQSPEKYADILHEISDKYRKQLSQIIEEYNNFYINAQLELQESECNQKIAITNFKKSIDIKQKVYQNAQYEFIEEYDKKINACIQKKDNYDIIIEECEKKLNHCAEEMENKINLLFSDKSNQILLREENGFKKFINKIKNKFIGQTKFNAYVIEPLNVELEVMENKLPNITNNIRQDTVKFVAKIKQAKDKTNQIFENMI